MRSRSWLVDRLRPASDRPEDSITVGNYSEEAATRPATIVGDHAPMRFCPLTCHNHAPTVSCTLGSPRRASGKGLGCTVWRNCGGVWTGTAGAGRWGRTGAAFFGVIRSPIARMMLPFRCSRMGGIAGNESVTRKRMIESAGPDCGSPQRRHSTGQRILASRRTSVHVRRQIRNSGEVQNGHRFCRAIQTPDRREGGITLVQGM